MNSIGPRRRLLLHVAACRLITCAWIDTSSAETGSSQTSRLGLQDQRPGQYHPLTLPARQLMRESLEQVGRGSPTAVHQRATRTFQPLWPAQPSPNTVQRFGHLLPAPASAGRCALQRILINHLHERRRSRAPVPARASRAPLRSSNRTSPPLVWHQPQDQPVRWWTCRNRTRPPRPSVLDRHPRSNDTPSTARKHRWADSTRRPGPARSRELARPDR